MAGRMAVLVRATMLVSLIVLCCRTGLAAEDVPQRRGKVVIIRGAMTVFSLGMNELGDKLAQHGLDVEVIADISTDRATSRLIAEYRRNRNLGPLIFIGHSRGAELGPKAAGTLQAYKIPVKLIVMVDAVHPTTVPANVERCVNLYHDSSLGFIHGVPARATSKRTQMINVDIDRLRTREQGGSINHFNIDSSEWIHDLVITQVLKVCPVVDSPTAPATAHRKATVRTRKRATAPAEAENPPVRSARRESASGLTYPSAIDGGLWADPAPHGTSAPRGSAEPHDRGSAAAVPDVSTSRHATPKKLTDTSQGHRRER